MKKIIKEFLEEAPNWLYRHKIPSKVSWENGACMLCGTNPSKVEELYEALKEEFGPIKIKVIK